MGKIYSFHHPEISRTEEFQNFQLALNEILIQNTKFQTPESIAMALQTLYNYTFEQYQHELLIFVKECILKYLDDTSPMIRKAASQAVCLLYERKKGRSKTLKQ